MATVDRLSEAIQTLTDVRDTFPPETVFIAPDGNLPSVLADLSAGANVVLSPTFVHTGGLTFTKPVTLVGGTLIGPMVCAAPAVRFKGVTLKGQHKDHTILKAADETLVEDCTLTGSAQGQHRGILVNARGITIRRTTITGIWHASDTQAIGGWDGTKDLLVEDCPLLEASGETLIFGGGDPTSASGIPQDIIIRRCHLSKPLAWRPLPACTNKNLFELKNCQRVLVEDVTMERSWVDGQDGYAISVKATNQQNTAPWSVIEDVTFRRVQVTGCAGGISLSGRGGGEGGIWPTQGLKRVTFEDVTIDDISPHWGTNQRVIKAEHGSEDLTFRRCTFRGSSIYAAMLFDGSPVHTRFVVDGCELPEGEYGIKGTGLAVGLPSLNAYAPNAIWTSNTVRINTPRPRVVSYPAGTVVTA